MQEFTTASSSSYDPATLAAKLTEMSSDGWTVVSIVSTGGDVTAFLSRAAGAADIAAASIAPAAAEPAAAATVAEPAGWAVAPDPAPATPTVEPQPATTSYTPAAAATTVAATAASTPAAAATPAVPAGWYADPAGRFELRYWDGATWTEHVSRAGQQYTDPPVA